MAQYISKLAVIAEIDKLKDEALEYEDKSRWFLAAALKKRIESLEVKEVDLEKEIQRQYNVHKNPNNSIVKDCVIMTKDGFEYFAKHFFELGLKKRQKNIWHFMNETPNYPCDILFLTDIDNMFLYRYMENGSPVNRETPYFGNILNGKCWCYCDDVKAQKGE